MRPAIENLGRQHGVQNSEKMQPIIAKHHKYHEGEPVPKLMIKLGIRCMRCNDTHKPAH